MKRGKGGGGRGGGGGPMGILSRFQVPNLKHLDVGEFQRCLGKMMRAVGSLTYKYTGYPQ